MPTLIELRDAAQTLYAQMEKALASGDAEVFERLSTDFEARRADIARLGEAETRMKTMQGEWLKPTNAVPMTSQEQRDMRLNDEEKGARTDANFRPRGWAVDLESRTALGPAIQPPWIQTRMGQNLREEARAYVEVFEKWMRAPRESSGAGSFFQEASDTEKRLLASCFDKEHGGYFIPEQLRRNSEVRSRWPEVRAMGENTDVSGGLLVPEDFRPFVIHDPGAPGNVIRPRCRVITTSLRDGYLPTFGTVAWAAMNEGGTYGDNTPTTGQVSFTVRKSGGQVVVAMELLEDTAIQLPPLLNQVFVEARGRYEDQKAIAGDGTTEPEGLRTALGSSQTVTLAGSSAIIATDVLNAYWSLPAQFRKQASWYLTSVLMQQIMGIGATAAGIHFGGGADNVDLRVAPDQVLLGKPVDLFDGTGWDMASPISTGEVIGAFGNFAQGYMFVDRVGMSLRRDDSVNIKSDQVWFGARQRMDGRVSIKNAFRLIKAA